MWESNPPGTAYETVEHTSALTRRKRESRLEPDRFETAHGTGVTREPHRAGAFAAWCPSLLRPTV
ncbi:hypothetical protein Hesp01_70490 [Herbidospora sp. NBRC 101105]|nr:hypothetical protein Hesp01_70490 [Herbidospora sp. NBRC 101105]